MRFRVERDEFTEAVAWAARSLPSRTATATQQQVLTGLLLDASGPGLVVAAFDYEVAAQAKLDATIDEEGRALAPGKMLADITKQLPAAPVDVFTDGTGLVVACGNARFTLRTLPVDEYPTLPPLPPVTGYIEGGVFGAAVSQVAIAAGKDETLPVLTGVRLEIEGDSLTLAATDRYRLAVRALKWRPENPEAAGTALVPARTLLDTARSLAGGGVEVAIALGTGPSGEALIGFAGNGRQTTTRLVEGQFPPYRKLLPDTCPLSAQVAKAPLLEAVKRVALVAPKTAPVKLSFTDDHLALEAGSNGGEAQASETMVASYSGPGQLDVAFNPTYLQDALSAIDSDQVEFGFASADDVEIAAKKPAILTGKAAGDEEIPDYRYLLMPIQLNTA
jgi:DNA polymerase-3 subunit beta